MARDCGGTSFVTTAPAEITAPEPMVIPGAIMAPCAIQTSSPMLRGPLAPSLLSANRTIGATMQRSPMVINLVSLDGGVVEVRAISYSDFGSGVTDEFGGNCPSNKSNPVSQPDCAFILDAHGTISVDTSASFTVSEKDCATNEGYDAAKRMAGISLKALEEAPHKMRVGLYGRSSAFPLPGGSGAGGGSSANDRATGDNAAAAHSCAGQNDDATFESDSGFDDNRNRLRLLHPFAQLMKAVVEDLASFSDLASVADLRGQESLNRCAALDLDVIAQDHFGARANVEFDRRAGGIEADSVPDPERSATVDPDPALQPTAKSLAPCSGGVSGGK